MLNFFPNDEDAKRLKEQTYLLSDFLQEKVPDFQLPKFSIKATLHGHCHHKSIFKMDAEEAVLNKMGVRFNAPETGCCGMAGAFGFERDHYDISMKCGERVLLPAVRETERDALIITDGFSCREQIAQTTDRKALHLAEVIHLALKDESSELGDYPERKYLERRDQSSANDGLAKVLLVGAGALTVGCTFLWIMKRKREN
ncbi:MAG TPA: (Fe-S)-binding protein, partial [Pyrinomonadaceae bacterium]|nr:(Fe-S)-binding protein [Pyrinomonadaceae bacterium]